MSSSEKADRRELPYGADGAVAETFHVEVKPDSDRVLVCPAGEVDLATADTLEREIVELVQNGFDRVVIDLRAITFIDSTGIRALLNAHHQARDSGAAVSIILGGPATRLPLDLTGITDYLELDPGTSDGTP